jgi:hypothetical protein
MVGDLPERALSLDRPDANGFTLGSHLAAPTIGPTHDRSIAEALYRALRKLPIMRQRELKDFFQLSDFVPHANARRLTRKPVRASAQAAWSLRHHAYAELRRDHALREAVHA